MKSNINSFFRIEELRHCLAWLLLMVVLFFPSVAFGQKELKTDDYDGFKYYELRDEVAPYEYKYKIEDLDGKTLVPWQPEGYLICYQSTSQTFEVFKSQSHIDYFKKKYSFEDLAIYSRDGRKLFDCTPYDKVFLHMTDDGRYFYEVYKDKKCAVFDGGGNMLIPFGKTDHYVFSSKTNTLNRMVKEGKLVAFKIVGDEYEDTGVGLPDTYKLKVYPKVPKDSGSELASAQSSRTSNTSTANKKSTQQNCNNSVFDNKAQEEALKQAMIYSVGKEYAKAAELYRKCAEAGNAEGQYWLGIFYVKGQGVQESLAESFKWFKKAADQGNVNAQFMVGEYYKNGTYVEKDLWEARKWFKKAADQGDETAREEWNMCGLEIGSKMFK